MIENINSLIYLTVSFIASVIGSISGIGGGVVIKPSLDALNRDPIASINFLSGCTVFAMSIVTVLRNLRAGIKLDLRVSVTIGVGAIFGGIAGGKLFSLAENRVADPSHLAIFQSAIMLLICVIVLAYLHNKERINNLNLTQLWVLFLIGLSLGIISTFLGIGGGPLNLLVLYYFLSMDEKNAAMNSIFMIFLSQFASLITLVAGRSIPNFDPLTLILMIIGGITGALLGAFINKKISNQGVAKLFRLVLILLIVINSLNIIKFL